MLNWLKGQQKKKADPTSEKHATQADASEGDVKEPKSEDSQDKPSIEKTGEAETAADAESPNSPFTDEHKEEIAESEENSSAPTPTAETQPLMGKDAAAGAPLVPVEQTIP